MRRWLLGVLMALGLASAARAAATGSDAEAALQCLRDNLPRALALRVRAETEVEGGETQRQEWLYARRPAAQEHRELQWLRLLAPAEVAGVVHLFRPLEEGAERYSFLPALGRVRRVEGEAVAAGLEDVIGLEALTALRRWPADATLSFGAARTESGRSVRPLYATRRVGTAAEARFERMEGRFDEATCLILSMTWRDAEGRLRGQLQLDPLSLRRQDGHWLPARLSWQSGDGRRSRLQILEVRVAPPFSRAVFDPRRFHRAGARDLGLAETAAP
jgi:hypothetical protein